MKLRPLLLALLGGLLSTAPLQAQLTDYTVTDLGLAPYNLLDAPGLSIIGLNNAGEVAVVSRIANGGLQLTRLTAGGPVDLGTLAIPAGATGVEYLLGGPINSAGHMVGTLYGGSGTVRRSFLSDGLQVIDLAPFDGRSINASGQIGGSAPTGGLPQAAIYSGGNVQTLGVLGTGTRSSANAINDAGQVAGSSNTVGNGNGHAFLYSGGVMQDLGTLGGVQSGANGINTAGWVTGWSEKAGFNAPVNAFLYNGTTMLDLGNLGGNFASGRSVNGSGQVLGYSLIAGPTIRFHEFLSSGGVMFDLNDLVGPETAASGFTSQGGFLNDAGQIATTATINGVRRSVLLTPTAVSATANLWTGGDGNWTETANWSLGLPDGSSEVRLARPTATTVTVDGGGAAVDSLRVYVRNHLRLDGDFTLNAGSSGSRSYNSNNGRITIGELGSLNLFNAEGQWDGVLDNQGTLRLNGDSSLTLNNVLQVASIPSGGNVLTGGTWFFATASGYAGGPQPVFRTAAPLTANQATIIIHGGVTSPELEGIQQNEGTFHLENANFTTAYNMKNSGTLTLHGGVYSTRYFEQTADGVLQVSLGGANASRLETTAAGGSPGYAYLNGRLDVSLAPGASVSLGDVFTVIDHVGERVGGFADYTGLELGGGVFLTPVFTANAFQLKASQLAVWSGASGAWENAAAWSTGAVPPTTTTAAALRGAVGTSVTLQGTGAALDYLSIDTGNSLQVNAGELSVPTLLNHGSLAIATGATLRSSAYAGAGAFSNLGTAIFAEGANVTGPVAQLAGGTLTGGTWQVGESGPYRDIALRLGTENIVTNRGTVRLFGGAQFAQLASLEHNEGTLELYDGNRTVIFMLTNEGTISLQTDQFLFAPTTLSGFNFTQTATGRLEIEIAGTGFGQSGLVEMFGDVTLDGTFKVSLVNGFAPGLGDAFTAMTYAGRTGNFSTYLGLKLSPSLILTPTYTANAMLLTVTALDSGTSAPAQPVTPGGTAPIAPTATYAGLTSASATGSGNQTVASVLDGSATGSKNVTIDFTPAGNFAAGAGGTLVSDIVEFSGTGSDLFVLQIDYNEAALLIGQQESELFLAWFNGSEFVNAVLGNSDLGLQQQAFIGAYDSGTMFTLGNYGVDPVANRVWAVVDHNSKFGAGGPTPAPEPGSLALLGLGGWLLAARRRR